MSAQAKVRPRPGVMDKDPLQLCDRIATDSIISPLSLSSSGKFSTSLTLRLGQKKQDDLGGTGNPQEEINATQAKSSSLY